VGLGWMYWKYVLVEVSRRVERGKCTMCGLFGTVDTARRVTNILFITRSDLSIRRGASVVVGMLGCILGLLQRVLDNFL